MLITRANLLNLITSRGSYGVTLSEIHTQFDVSKPGERDRVRFLLYKMRTRDEIRETQTTDLTLLMDGRIGMEPNYIRTQHAESNSQIPELGRDHGSVAGLERVQEL